MISEKQLIEIEALANAATPGPWWSDGYNTIFSGKGKDYKIIAS